MNSIIWLLATSVVCATAASINQQNESGKIRYDNYKVYKLSIKNKAQLAVLDVIQANQEKYNIWKDYDEASKEIHVMVNPQENADFQRMLKFNGYESKVMINNVQDLIDEEHSSSKLRAANGKFDWTRYHTLEEIEEWLDGILAKYPNVTEGFTIGQSYENRTIRGIKISYRSGNPGIFIESNIHAREWITSASATWLINELLSSSNETVRNLAESYDWYIIAVFNVDGFRYSHLKDRLWRKTRQLFDTTRCVGTDANRNFDSHWMENNGASSNPCRENFAGPKPFSEPETAALAKFVESNKDKINIYIAFHSYSQLLLSPYGHTREEVPANYDDLQEIGKAFCDAVFELPYKTEYEHGATALILYVASGASVDWSYDKLGIKIGYTIEFRDKGEYGFFLPAKYIVPNSREVLAGLIALSNKAKELKYV